MGKSYRDWKAIIKKYNRDLPIENKKFLTNYKPIRVSFRTYRELKHSTDVSTKEIKKEYNIRRSSHKRCMNSINHKPDKIMVLGDVQRRTSYHFYLWAKRRNRKLTDKDRG